MGPKLVTFDKGRILSVTQQGIEYRDDDGRDCLIDFDACGGHSPHRHVGYRDCSPSPPFFEFWTEPRTRFVFRAAAAEVGPGLGDWYKDFRWLEEQLWKAGWATIDLA
jgi:hypothetical protein